MEAKVAAIYTGPSIYSSSRVVRFRLDLGTAPTAESLSTQVKALGSALPGLLKTNSTGDAPDSVTNGESPEPCHLFEHICVELQNMAGARLSCARCADSASTNTREAIVAYEEADICIEAARVTASWFDKYLKPETQPTAASLAADMEAFHEFSEDRALPVQDRALLRSARERKVPAIRLMGRILQLGQGVYQKRLSATKTTLTSVVSNDIATNKDYSRRLLEELGLPSPRYERVYRGRAAVKAAVRIGFPVVVKPNSGNLGKGVVVGVKTKSEVRAAYKYARQVARSILIEELVEGADYRMLLIGGKLVAAAKRVPAHVVGDGIHSIKELVDEINRDPRRGVGARFAWTKISLNEKADQLLAELGYTTETVPREGEEVFLRRNANTSDGGTAVDVTDQVHPDNVDISVRAALAMGLDIAGVDLLTTDISQSIWEAGGAICEINSRPGLRKHMWPAQGQPRDVTGPIVDMLFPPGAPSRVALAAVTGAGNRAFVARLLAHILSHSGRHVGLVTGGRALVDGRAVHGESVSLPVATRTVFIDPRVDTVVIDAAPDEIAQYGLGHDACEVCTIVGDSRTPLPSSDLESIAVVARGASEAILLSGGLNTNLGEADIFCVGRRDRSNQRRPLIKFERNAHGKITRLVGMDNRPLSVGPSIPLTVLEEATDDAEQCILYSCATAAKMGINSATVRSALRCFSESSYGDGFA
ncbi:MAG: cyanophycin synthetase family protein [Gammaproteobacteria bacterium]